MEVDLASPNDYFPQTEYSPFAAPPKLEAMSAKLAQFNAEVPPEKRLSEEQLAAMKKFCNKGTLNIRTSYHFIDDLL